MERLVIHRRIMERHPEVAPEDVAFAWANRIAFGERDTDPRQICAAGFDAKGRMLEMVAALEEDGSVLVFHAMTPPSKKTLREIGLI